MSTHITEIAKLMGLTDVMIASALETKLDPELLAPDPNLTIEEAEEGFYQCPVGSPEAEAALIKWVCLCTTLDEIKETLEYMETDVQTETIIIHKLAQIIGA